MSNSVENSRTERLGKSSKTLKELKRSLWTNRATLIFDAAAFAGGIYLNRKFFGTAIGDNAVLLTAGGLLDSLRSTGNIFDYDDIIRRKRQEQRDTIIFDPKSPTE
ncbi:MAG TPA: hypothetical protein VFD45_00630 [Patescibacteria group bacterium]|nr:hypothetical protein [Patescibacteria group bacterium]